ncbi:MAG: glycosyltransferase [Anaerolineae bacterium]|nr:glycosyltransferase [Anaerolineae bacterium]
MPRVSVIIPSYNHAQYIGEAVESVLQQTEDDTELIIVDDGSTDNTSLVLRRFTDPRMRVIFQEHQGAHAALNRGLQEARGRYLAILNSDDLYHPRRLEKLLAELERNPDFGLIGSYIEVIDARGNSLGVKRSYRNLEPWILPEPEKSFRVTNDARGVLLTENFYATTSNFVFRRDLYEQIGGFRPLRYTHDWDFLLRSALVTTLEIFPEPLLKYRVHPRNTIRENLTWMVFEICWCLAVHLPQHLEDSSWFGQEPPYHRIERLLHSIYVFGCDKVLAIMLMRRLQLGSDWAMRLLNPDNMERKIYLDFISKCIRLAGKGSSSSDFRKGSILHKLWRLLA